MCWNMSYSQLTTYIYMKHGISLHLSFPKSQKNKQNLDLSSLSHCYFGHFPTILFLLLDLHQHYQILLLHHHHLNHPHYEPIFIWHDIIRYSVRISDCMCFDTKSFSFLNFHIIWPIFQIFIPIINCCEIWKRERW